MLLRKVDRRAGFNLVELMVVLGIITVLASLVLAAVMKAQDIGPRTETTARLATISQGIGQFKSQYHVNYIPAGSVDIVTGSNTFGQVVGPFRLKNSYTGADANSFEAQYIAQVFGSRVNLSDLGNPNLAGNLDANQTLLFFLNGIPVQSGQTVYFSGFSRNPQKPFTPEGATVEDRRKPILDISDRHYIVDSSGFPRLIDGWKTPMAYFVSYNGKNNTYGGFNQGLGFPNNTSSNLIQPYKNGAAFVNPSGFQIIAAGKDKMFGFSGNWQSVDGYGQDDQANFANGLLGSGPQ